MNISEVMAKNRLRILDKKMENNREFKEYGKNLDVFGVEESVLKDYFGILMTTGIPFSEEPRIKSRICSTGSNGFSLTLYDKTEPGEMRDNPRLGVEVWVFDKTRKLYLFAGNLVPQEHLLEKNRGKIVTRCKEACENMGLIFFNQFYPGYSRKSATARISECLLQAAKESCPVREQKIELGKLEWEIKQLGFLEVYDSTGFRKQAIRLTETIGLRTTPQEKLRFLNALEARLKIAGILEYK